MPCCAGNKACYDVSRLVASQERTHMIYRPLSETAPASSMDSLDGPIRSRFRGLSWDKKHQGWRVRIYYAGKQRHVGRFEDDITAAKAYDKAAVYLYGTNAITNFPLEACLADHTEVSGFIVIAKEQVDQEQQSRGQQRPHAQPSVSPVIQAVAGYTCAHDGSVYPKSQPMAPACQQRQAPLPASWQLQQPGPALSAAMSQDVQQSWHQQLLQQAAADQQMQYVMLAPQATHADTISNSSSTTSMLAVDNVALNSTGTNYMVCSNPCVQSMAAVPSMGYADTALAVMPVQPGSCAQQQILQQPQQFLLFNSNTQPLQLPMQPQVSTIASHMAASAAANHLQQPQQIILQQLSDLALPISLPCTVASADCSAMQLHTAGHPLATASAGIATSSMDMLLLNSAVSGGEIACAQLSTAGNMPLHIHPYPTATAGFQHAGLAALHNQQQRHGCLVSSNSISSGLESNSSMCSPLIGPGHFPIPLTAPAATPSMVTAHANRSMIYAPPTGAGLHLAGSPTFSSSSSGSSKSKSCGFLKATVVF